MTPEQLTAAILKIQTDMATLTEQTKGMWKRIDEQKALTESVHKIAMSLEVQSQEMKQMRKEQEKMQVDLEEIKAEPGKKWKTTVAQVTSILIAGILGALVSGVIAKIL